jgi:hypothetical protein
MKIRFERPLSVESYVADTVYRLPTAAASLVAARSDLSTTGCLVLIKGSKPPCPRSGPGALGYPRVR